MALSLSRTTGNGFPIEGSLTKEIGLIVHVVEARNLLNKDLFGGKSNPFVVLKVWGQERVSHVVKNCLSPKWDQTFMFSLYTAFSPRDVLVASVWDKDQLFKNGFLGMVTIPLKDLQDNQTRDLWYPLEKRSSKSRVKGNLRLWTQLTTSDGREGIEREKPFQPLKVHVGEYSEPSSSFSPSLSSFSPDFSFNLSPASPCPSPSLYNPPPSFSTSPSSFTTPTSFNTSVAFTTPVTSFNKSVSLDGASTAPTYSNTYASTSSNSHFSNGTDGSNEINGISTTEDIESLIRSVSIKSTSPAPSSATLDESDFLYIETSRDVKGKGKEREKPEWPPSPHSPHSYSPSLSVHTSYSPRSPHFPLSSPSSPSPSSPSPSSPSPSSPSPSSPSFPSFPCALNLPSASTTYYDAFGDAVEDADMIAILQMEEEEKRLREMEEDRMLHEYLQRLACCSVCGAEDLLPLESSLPLENSLEPLTLPCDHTFCRNCLASHIRLSSKQNGRLPLGYVTCPTPSCQGRAPEWAVKRALPPLEYEALLNLSLQEFIDSGTGIFRCPTATCGAPIERIPYQPKNTNQYSCTNEEIIEHHREEYRFRCRSCSTEFCSGCMVIPYHVGYTCEGFSRYLKAKHCRFCAVTLDSVGANTNDVCKGEECLEKAKICCKKWNPCGHACGGVLDEANCLPCLQCKPANNGTSEQCADDYCNICWVESLGSAPAVKLKCGHVFHYSCVHSKIKKRWPAARITFGFSECPLCKHTIEHPAFEADLKPIRDLKATVQLKASQRLEFEGLSKAKELVDPSSKFFNNRERYAMDRYAYFMCDKCTQPYFAGQRRCDAGEEDKPFDPADLVCGACCGSSLTECATHGKDFLEYKCQFCCTVSSWYCWGKTHFCNDCHTRQQKGDYLTKKPKSAIPMCPGVDKCPLGVAHPHCEEFLLGCALCRNVRSF